MGFHALYLLPDILLQIIKGMEVRRRAKRRSHLVGQLFLQLIFFHFQQAAIRMVDDDELLGVEQVMGNNQRPYGVLSGNPARIADHVRISWLQSQAAFKQDSGIHASQYGQPTPRLNGKFSQVEAFYKFLIGF